MRFYCTKWPIECGIIVCDGDVTAKRAKISEKFRSNTKQLTTFTGTEFTTSLSTAKTQVEHKLLDDIRYHELRIERLKSALKKTRELTDDAAIWSNTRGDDPEVKPKGTAQLTRQEVQRLCGAGRVIEVEEATENGSATGGSEIVLTFEDGTELLVYVHENGKLMVNVD